MPQIDNDFIRKAIKVSLDEDLPEYPDFEPGIPRAPARPFKLSREKAEVALKNALRYLPVNLHEKLSPEFMEELITRGRIYAYRYRPKGRIWGKPIEQYKGKILAAKAIQVMIDNNLDFEVAQYPYELVTYGESGRVLQNWLQYRLIKKYLEILEENQTLVVYSGHPLGIFNSRPKAPRVINSNGIMVGMYDNLKDWEIAAEMGVTSYGQMTAGGWFYIGPQGIIHGCYNLLLHAARKYGLSSTKDDLSGVLYITAGLGSISSAQAKAAQISNCVAVIAEVNHAAIERNLKRNWIDKVSDNLDEIFRDVNRHLESKKGIVIAYYGNIVNLLEYVVKHEIEVNILSDQTSCHIPYEGGYIPVELTYEETRELLKKDRTKFREYVDRSLRKHFQFIKALTDRGTYFLEYGNSIMQAMYNAGVKEIARNGKDTSEGFIYPDFIEAITGPELFDYGYGPFRWVCLSGKAEDLRKTDEAAMSCIDPNKSPQDRDNYNWLKNAWKHDLVVGTKARMVYQNLENRIKIALKFNEMVRSGEIGPVMIGRDHHDTGSADCPIRETSNIKDGSNVTADMAVHCFAGNASRGMTFISIENGGGVGIGRSLHTGFGLLLDGSRYTDEVIRNAINWDVSNGIARRAWARNTNSIKVAVNHNLTTNDIITLPFLADNEMVKDVVSWAFKKYNIKTE
ncbi:MAG: urocanate hydratase [Synergistetes bacterium]|nr:urocanate hydratase [Synergistota bacterium]